MKNFDFKFKVIITHGAKTRNDYKSFYFYANDLEHAEQRVKEQYPTDWYGANIIQITGNQYADRPNFSMFAVKEYYDWLEGNRI